MIATTANYSPARRSKKRIVAILLLVWCCAGLIFLFKCREAMAQRRPVFVTASFLDKNGLFIENLDKSEVEILEDGNPRKIEFMAKDELPAVYGIIFDRGMLPDSTDDERFLSRMNIGAISARSIAYEMIDKYLGRQAVWVAAYEQEFQLVHDAAADGFAAKSAIQQLRGRKNPEEAFLYAALFSAVQKMNERHEKRRILLLFIEDLDGVTVGKIKPMKNLLSASNVELFAVNFGTKLGTRPGRIPYTLTVSSLNELAQVTAGQAFDASNYRDHLEDLVRKMYNHVRTLYSFGFEAESGKSAVGKLEIKCSRPGAKVIHHPLVPAFR